MKRMQLLSAILLITVAATTISCKSSRVWATKEKPKKEKQVRYADAPVPPPRYNPSVALVITPTPGFTMQRFSDGRYYHRSQTGLLYWKGYDNRFFLDRSYLSRVNYSQWEYDEWKRYSRGRG